MPRSKRVDVPEPSKKVIPAATVVKKYLPEYYEAEYRYKEAREAYLEKLEPQLTSRQRRVSK
jgi:hypothetical protein